MFQSKDDVAVTGKFLELKLVGENGRLPAGRKDEHGKLCASRRHGRRGVGVGPDCSGGYRIPCATELKP
jgi:hypothetical protein